MHSRHQDKRFKKSTTYYTPSWLSNWIHNYSSLLLDPIDLVLDPCIGIGSMTDPFGKTGSKIIGIDTVEDSHLWCDDFMHIKFELLCDWPYDKPDLVLCNPPFNGYPGGMMYPEVFARHLISLLGNSVPIWIIVPHTFRLTPARSARRKWLNSNDFSITMIVSLPTDCFSNANIHSELLLVNAPISVTRQPVLMPPK